RLQGDWSSDVCSSDLARGERLTHLTSPGRLKIAAAILLTSPFIPMIFQGEEWAASTPFQYFTGHPHPDLAHAVREGRKREFTARSEERRVGKECRSRR